MSAPSTPSSKTAPSGFSSAVREYLDDHRDRIRAELAEWVAIGSVAGDAAHEADVQRSAEWLASALRDLGFPEVDVHPTGDSFAVTAAWDAEVRSPTVLVYSHHDVRAAKAEEWSVTSPFQPVLRGRRLYGRGASDAKGQLLAHLWSIRAALHVSGQARLPVNLRIIVEGEEELGSPHLHELLRRESQRLRCDAVVFSDTLQWRAGEPALCDSVRGMIGASLEVRGPTKDIHSGAASGPAPNPTVDLAAVISALFDEDGRIALPGFYDDVHEVSPSRRAQLAQLSYSDEDWLRRTHTPRIVGEDGYTALERLWERPSLEVVSLLAGDPTGMPRAVIPSAATASLSIRTVAGQTCAQVAEQLRAFVHAQLGGRVDYELDIALDTAQEPYRTPEGAAHEALDRAMRAGYDTDVVRRMGNAGGGPAQLIAAVFDAPVLFFGTGLPEDYWHDSDESVDLDELSAGARTLAHLWYELGDALASGADAGAGR